MTRPEIARLPASFGVEIDIDLTRMPSDAEAAELRRLMTEHGLLVFRGHTLTGDQQRLATACFGRVSEDEDGKPLQMHVSNRRESSAPIGELIFHYDYAYDPDPIEFISLYGEEIGDGATPTLFASSTRALDILPGELKSRISGYTALQACFMDRAAPTGERAAMNADCIPRGQPGWSAKDWRNVQKLIWENRAGVPALYACVQHTVRIMELPIDESDALLKKLFGYIYTPANVYTHSWQEGDLVVWDNRTVQHCRPAPNDVARTLRRYEVSDEDLTKDYLAIGRTNKFV